MNAAIETPMTGYRRVGAWAAVGVLACLWLPALPAQSGASSAAAALAQLLKPAPATQPGQSATLLPDGIWLLLGGQDGNGMPVPTALLVDLKTKRTVELLSGLSQARTAHSATLVPDGSVVVLGG